MKNRILKRSTSLLLILALIVSGLFSYPKPSYGETTTLSDTIYYHLDMGVQVTYAGPSWVNNGLDYGATESFTATIGFPNEISVLDAYPLNSAKGSSYDFAGATSSNNIPKTLISGAGSALEAYSNNYKTYVSTSMSSSGTPSSSGSDVTFSYQAYLNTATKLDVVKKGADGYDSEVWKLFGGINNVYDAGVKAAISDALLQGKNNTAGTNRLYLVFCPMVIKYKKYVTIPDVPTSPAIAVGTLDAVLTLPSEAKQDENYNAVDSSVIESTVKVTSADLEISRDNGSTWSNVTTWYGNGTAGANTGGSKLQSMPDIEILKYRLTVHGDGGQVDTDIKTISIKDKRTMSLDANLLLPQTTFEGHTVVAKDDSSYLVNGTAYSPERAYVENLADNEYSVSSNLYGSISKISSYNGTRANAVFTKAGNYSVTLNCETSTGERDSDTKDIEVIKTPSVTDILSGMQKQNRKQILNITVATYPGKPITGFTIALKDKKTGNSISLNPGTLQQNTTTIKTRTLQKSVSADGCFTYFTLEFLTKTPNYDPANPTATQDFYYQIDVTDSKGDSDMTSKTFAVAPDLPPNPTISLQNSFLRNEGSNTTAIKAEDMTVASDGDGIERTWYYSATSPAATFANAATLSGYQKLSFGTDKNIGFNRIGVGKFCMKLLAKEVWTEPTLEEYVTDADRLSATSKVYYSDVTNIPPTVGLKLQSTISQDILLTAIGDAEYQALLNKKTELDKALIENGIDGNFTIKKLLGGTPSNITGLTETYKNSGFTPFGNAGNAYPVNEKDTFEADRERIYLLTYDWSTDYPRYPTILHAYNISNMAETWRYTLPDTTQPIIGQDDQDKYLYLIYSASTTIIDKRTGAVAGTIAMPIPSKKIFIKDESTAFALSGTDLYKLNLGTATKTVVAKNVYVPARVSGKLQYISKTTDAVIRCTLDMSSLIIKTESVLSALTLSDFTSPNIYVPVCIDSAGKLVVYVTHYPYDGKIAQLLVFDKKNNLINRINDPTFTNISKGCNPCFDENGEISTVLIEGYEEMDWENTNVDAVNGINDDYWLTYGIFDVKLNTAKIIYQNSQWTYRRTGDHADMREMIGRFDTSFQVGDTSYYWYFGEICLPFGYVIKTDDMIISYNRSTGAVKIYTSFKGALNDAFEKIVSSDRYVIATSAINTPYGYQGLQVSEFPRSSTQEVTETKNRYSASGTYLGNINTTADQLVLAAKAEKPAVKLSAFTTLRGLIKKTLEKVKTGTRYYAEYSLKPLTAEGKANVLTSYVDLSYNTAINNYGGETYYTEKRYVENFEGLTGTSREIFDIAGSCDAGNKVSTMLQNGTITFTVPAGKQAVLSFDYNIYGISTYNDRAVRVNRRWEDPGFKPDNFILLDGSSISHNFNFSLSTQFSTEIVYRTSGYYKANQYYGPGTHTIKVQNPYGGYGSETQRSYIDNVTVDIVSTTPQKTTIEASNVTAMSDGWYKITSNFLGAANIMEYDSQSPNNIKKQVGGPINVYFVPKQGEYLVKDIKIYYIENGNKVYLSDSACGDLSDITAAPNTSYADMSISMSTDSKAAEEDPIKIYKKGELVSYNILYNDYEKDPSKKQYWVYTHTPFAPDTVHPDVGKVLSKPIERFYLSGKYTVTHWQEDDTSRVTAAESLSDNAGLQGRAGFDLRGLIGYTGTDLNSLFADAAYDKASNQVTMTFYVNSEVASAPWVNYINTDPAKVIEGSNYGIKVGIDDKEKDTLTLETELYRDGVLLNTFNKTGITATAGTYPEQVIPSSSLAAAVPGTYQIVCTVSDNTGTGVKVYKFVVDSVKATVVATNNLKSGYGITAKVTTTSSNSTVSNVVAILPNGTTVTMVCTAASGNNKIWEFPPNTGKYADQYNQKYSTTSRQVFVPVKWPDKTNYTIYYKVYDATGDLRRTISSDTYIDGNMYDDDYTVSSE